MDERKRELERAAARGDLEAIAKLERVNQRLTSPQSNREKRRIRRASNLHSPMPISTNKALIHWVTNCDYKTHKKCLKREKLYKKLGIKN